MKCYEEPNRGVHDRLMIPCSLCLRAVQVRSAQNPRDVVCVFLWLCRIRNLRSCVAACMRDWKGSGHCTHKGNICAMVFVFAAFVHFSIQCKYEQQSFINVSCLRRVKLTTPLARSSPGFVIPRWGVVKASAWDNHLKRLALRSGCRWVKLWKSLPSSCSDMLQWFCSSVGFSG